MTLSAYLYRYSNLHSQMKSPKIDTFRVPQNAWMTSIPMFALIYTTFAPDPSSPSYSPLFAVAHAVREAVGGPRVVSYFWYLLIVLHSLESFYTLSLCRKHQTPLIPAVSAMTPASPGYSDGSGADQVYPVHSRVRLPRMAGFP